VAGGPRSLTPPAQQPGERGDQPPVHPAMAWRDPRAARPSAVASGSWQALSVASRSRSYAWARDPGVGRCGRRRPEDCQDRPKGNGFSRATRSLEEEWTSVEQGVGANNSRHVTMVATSSSRCPAPPSTIIVCRRAVLGRRAPGPEHQQTNCKADHNRAGDPGPHRDPALRDRQATQHSERDCRYEQQCSPAGFGHEVRCSSSRRLPVPWAPRAAPRGRTPRLHQLCCRPLECVSHRWKLVGVLLLAREPFELPLPLQALLGEVEIGADLVAMGQHLLLGTP